MSDAERTNDLVKRYCNAMATFAGAGGHGKAERNKNLAEAYARKAKARGVALPPQIAAELYAQNRAGVTLKQRDFLTLTPDNLGAFDAVIMNPPFHMRSDIRHIEHARKFLKAGGTLAAICMDTPQRRKAFARCTWHDLPPRTFKETGTNIGTGIIVIQ